ncbi:hypothetical protein [Nostoc sp.]|uniref:hypothetical protein n=1 Tax=Nostoc sp. TaxID=1180 RepID=UPI002FF60B5C
MGYPFIQAILILQDEEASTSWGNDGAMSSSSDTFQETPVITQAVSAQRMLIDIQSALA